MDLKNLFLSPIQSDVVFDVSGKRMNAHQEVLTSKSNHFESEFRGHRGQVLTIKVNSESPLSFKNFLKFFYFGPSVLDDADTQEKEEILKLALKYQVTELVDELIRRDEKQVSTVTNSKKPQDNAKVISFQTVACQVVKGLNPKALFEDQLKLLEMNCTRHKIEETSRGIVIKLQTPSVINAVRFHLWDESERSYGYYLEVSEDDRTWFKIVDFSNYWCRSWQALLFDQCLVSQLRLVGTASTERRLLLTTRYFTVTRFFCGLSNREAPRSGQFWKSPTNLASIRRGAMVIKNEYDLFTYHPRSKMINDMDIEYKIYNKIATKLALDDLSSPGPHPYVVVQLPQPFLIELIKFYIVGTKCYKYKVEVTTAHPEQKNVPWQVVKSDRNKFAAAGWQKIRLDRTVASAIKISRFQCIDSSERFVRISAFLCN